MKTSIKLDGTTYVNDLGPMVGKTIIAFQDSTFTYNERNILRSAGYWYISEDKRYVILKGRSDVLQKKNDGVFMIDVDLRLRVKNKKTLIDIQNGFTYVLISDI